MKLLESVDMVRHAMPGLNLEQQQGMIQDIAVSISNIRNGVDKKNLATERWQKVSCAYKMQPLKHVEHPGLICIMTLSYVHISHLFSKLY
jgi:hypothetical protein